MSVSEEGVLESPNFPKNYPGNMKCKWTLVAERDCDAVKINFTHIILEENYDTLTVCPQKTCHEDEKIILTGRFIDSCYIMGYSMHILQVTMVRPIVCYSPKASL